MVFVFEVLIYVGSKHLSQRQLLGHEYAYGGLLRRIRS